MSSIYLYLSIYVKKVARRAVSAMIYKDAVFAQLVAQLSFLAHLKGQFLWFDMVYKVLQSHLTSTYL